MSSGAQDQHAAAEAAKAAEQARRDREAREAHARRLVRESLRAEIDRLEYDARHSFRAVGGE